MRDPRLVEIEFLASLSRVDGLDVTQVSEGDLGKQYGVNPTEIRHLIFHLIVGGHVNGPARLISDDQFNSLQLGPVLETMSATDIRMYLKNMHVTLRINHLGRLRLWQLRDELRDARRTEPFGFLLDRAAFIQDLEIAFAFLATGQKLTLLVADLDNFKSVNDKLGHPAGDSALMTYLRVARDLSAKRGEAYRLGGDEIAVILPNTEASEAKQFADALAMKVASEMSSLAELRGHEPKPTMSGGLKTFAKQTSVQSAYEAADELLRRAKTAGKNRIEIG